ncbi:hypothetical protein ACHAPT_010892 [Fusarium lateritium]
MAKIFLTGATGYIGGDLLHLLTKSHPEYQVRVLIRDAAKGEAVSKEFNQVEVVYGGLDDAEIIAREAKAADVVLNLAAFSHLPSVQAIHQALSDKSGGQKPPYWIQISGASLLASSELVDQSRVSGVASDDIYNDLSGIESVQSLIKQYPARDVDNYMLSVATDTPQIKTALIVPPMIYGQGRGPGNQRSVQIPELAKATLQRQKGLQVGPGLSRWANIHVQDLSQVMLALIEKAVEGNEDDNIWGLNGIYLTAAGEMSFKEVSRRVTDAAYGLNLLPSEEVDELSGKEMDGLIFYGSVMFGTNVRIESQRAAEYLGWAPQNEDLEHEIPRAVAQEARALGLFKE